MLFSFSLIINDIYIGIYILIFILGLCWYEIVYINMFISGRKIVCFMFWYVLVNILVNVYFNK